MNNVRLCFLFPIMLLHIQLYAQEIDKYEYWIDQNYEERVVVNSFVPDIVIDISIQSLKPGLHYFYFRAHREDEVWGNPFRELFYVASIRLGSNYSVVGYEYWIDEDITKKVTVSSSKLDFDFIVDISGYSQGCHSFNFRIKDIFENWSDVYSEEFIINSEAYVLSISSSGKGNATYGPTSVRNTTQEFTQDVGTSVTITFTPDDGYRIKSVKVDGKDVTSSVSNNQYTISSISANTTVEVEFEAIPPTTYTLLIKATGNGVASYGGISVRNTTKTFTMSEGTSATITFTPDEGCRIKSVKVNSKDVTSSVSNNQYTVSNINANTTVDVEFEAIPTTFTVGGINYKMASETTAMVISAESSVTNLVIPQTVVNNATTYTVNSIAKQAFENNTSIVSAEIPNSVTYISDQAFYGCTNLKTVSIPNSISSIGYHVFSRCSSLESVTIPSSVTVLGEGAFYRCSSLRAITLQNSLTGIGTHAFYYCEKLQEVNSEIERPFSITDKVFEGIPATAVLQVPRGTKANYQQYVGWMQHFASVKEVGEKETFLLTIHAEGAGTVSCNGISIRGGSQSINITAGSSATLTFAPDEWYRLQSVVVDGKYVIPDYVNNQYTISDITADVTVVVTFEEIPKVFSFEGINYEIDSESTVMVTSAENRMSALVIPSNVLYNGVSFSVVSIGEDAFKDNVNLTSATIPNSVISIGKQAFYCCSSLKTITLPNSLTAIDSHAFFNCEQLEEVNSEIQRPFSISDKVFEGISANAVLQVPQGSKDSYLQYVGWAKHFKKIKEYGERETVTVSINAVGGGSVVCSGESVSNGSLSIEIPVETSVTLVLSPSDGYRVKSLKVNGVDVTSGIIANSYTISQVNEDLTVDAEFEEIPIPTYRLTITSQGDGTVEWGDGTVRGREAIYVVLEGANAELSFIPDDNCRIKIVKLNGENITSEISEYKYTIADIRSDMTLNVEFEKTPTFTLTLSAIGNGTVSFGAETIRSDSRNYMLLEGSDATIGFEPDAGNRIKVIAINGMDVTAEVRDGRYILSGITENVVIEVVFEEIITTFSIRDIDYEVISMDDKTIKVVSCKNNICIEVPDRVDYKDYVWLITSIDDAALSGCKDLAAVIWQPSVRFGARVSNQNLLLYVKDAAYAPSDIKNIVVNGVADQIALTDAQSGNNFCCPQAFEAKHISYSHHYGMTTGIGTVSGWETIALPFDVQKITHATKGEIIPFAKWTEDESAKPVWLYRLGIGGFIEADGMKAYTPYIISMPNHEQYQTDFRLSGNVTFESENVMINTSEHLNTASYNDRTFVPNFEVTDADIGYYALNVNNDYDTYRGSENEGSKFIMNLRQVHPFEAYMTSSSGTRSFGVFDGMTTSIKGIKEMSLQSNTLKVYDLRGVLIKTCSSLNEVVDGLPAGVYILNGRKVVVK